MLETISSALKELGELRKSHPYVGYIIILALLITVVFGILVQSKGNWLPLIIGVVLFIFFLFLLVVFSNAAKDDSKGVKYFLSLTMLAFVTIMFMVWVVLLTLAMVGKVCILGIGECNQPHEPATQLEMEIGKKIELRHWLEYLGKNGTKLPRSERLAGQGGLLFTPKFSLPSSANAPVTVTELSVRIELSGSASENYIFSPLILAGVGMANAENTFWNRQGDFDSITIEAGKGWANQVGAKAETKASYAEIVNTFLDKRFRMSLLSIDAKSGDRSVGVAECIIDLTLFREQVANFMADENGPPNFVSSNCTET